MAAKVCVMSLVLLMLGPCTGWGVTNRRDAIDQAMPQDERARCGLPDLTEILVMGARTGGIRSSRLRGV